PSTNRRLRRWVYRNQALADLEGRTVEIIVRLFACPRKNFRATLIPKLGLNKSDISNVQQPQREKFMKTILVLTSCLALASLTLANDQDNNKKKKQSQGAPQPQHQAQHQKA